MQQFFRTIHHHGLGLVMLLGLTVYCSSALAFMPLTQDNVYYEGKGSHFPRNGKVPLEKYKAHYSFKKISAKKIKITTHRFFPNNKTDILSFYAVERSPQVYDLLNEQQRPLGLGYCFLLKNLGDRKCHLQLGHEPSQDQDQGQDNDHHPTLAKADIFFTVKGEALMFMGQRIDKKGRRYYFREGYTRLPN